MMLRVETEPNNHVAVMVEGEGPLVLCAPGMGDLKSQYRHLSPKLIAAGYRVAVIDLRGHGDSDLGFSDFGPEAVGRDLLAVADALGAKTFVLIGNSAAAASAVWAAAEAPKRVAGLVLVGPVARDPMTLPGWAVRAGAALLSILPFNGRLWAWFYRSLFKAHRPEDHEAHVAHVRQAIHGAHLRSALLIGMSTKRLCSDRIGEVEAPTLIVMGTADPDFPDATTEAQELGELLRAKVVLMDGVGHYPHQERPAEVAESILTLLREDACRAALA